MLTSLTLIGVPSRSIGGSFKTRQTRLPDLMEICRLPSGRRVQRLRPGLRQRRDYRIGVADQRTTKRTSEKRNRHSVHLHAESVRCVVPIHRRRRVIDRQQPCRTADEVACDRPQELTVRRQPTGGSSGDRPAEHDCQLQTLRSRTPGLAERGSARTPPSTGARRT